jgi:DNA-binding protein HU-beta
MNGNYLIEEIQKDIRDEAIAKTVLNNIISNITDSLQRGESVKLAGFGTFKVIERKARKGVNPRTGEGISIPPKRVPKFIPGKKLKERIQ